MSHEILRTKVKRDVRKIIRRVDFSNLWHLCYFLYSPENIYSHALNAHERSHIRSEQRLKTLQWPWENEKTLKDDPSVDDKEDNDFYDEVMFSDRQLQRKFR